MNLEGEYSRRARDPNAGNSRVVLSSAHAGIGAEGDGDVAITSIVTVTARHDFLLGQLSLASLRGRLIEYQLRLG